MLPLAAQGPVSRIVGRDEPSYRAARAGGGGLVVRNRGQHLSARFDRRGVMVRSGGMSLRLRLGGYGYGVVSHAAGAVAPRAQANRVVYRRGAVDEWYVNGPLGLEQGFTFRARPAGRDAGPLTLSLALSGNVRAALSRTADAVTFTRAGVSLAYRGLVATDARGRQLPARVELRDGRLRLRIDDRGASYPLRIDPFVQQAKLTASNGAPDDLLGTSVAVSGDTIVAGAPEAQVFGNSSQGAAYVFVKAAGGWASETEAAKLTASDGGAFDGLGLSVAVSGDTVVAGAQSATVNGHPLQGAAYVFVKPAGGWASETEAAKLTASDGAGDDTLGRSVAVSGDTIVAGAPAQVNGQASQGAAYVFVKPADGWASETEAAKLTASDGAAVELGTSVAVSGDTVVAGAPFGTVNGPLNEGAAYVFVKRVDGWASETEAAKLTASDAAPGELGFSVAVSGDTIVAGAPTATVTGNSGQGAAYAFVKPAGGWASENEAAKLTASDGQAGDFLGDSVAASGDTVVAGAPMASREQGAAYVFVKPADGWVSETEATKLTASDGANFEDFGQSAAVAESTVVVGAPAASISGTTAQGAAYVFLGPGTTTTSMGCSPGAIAVSEPTTCRATVTDMTASPTTPTGTVSFSSDTGAGAFSNSGLCSLSPTAATGQAACQVTYTPGQVGSGRHTITARYGGDSTHLTSSASDTVTVSKRITRTRVRCSIKPRRSCTARVTDIATGAASTPTGTVTFRATTRHGRFSGKPCTLAGSGASASCSVTYRAAIRTRAVTARYSGDSTHAASSGRTAVTRPACRPSRSRWHGRDWSVMTPSGPRGQAPRPLAQPRCSGP
jgi:trimeric autotransporter adhesin